MNNITGLLKKYEFISAIGYEMECLIPKKFAEEVADNFDVYCDISIKSEVGYVTGEIKFFYYIEDIKGLFNTITMLWQKYQIKQNPSCGNHFHISFKDKNMYTRFLLPKTQKLFISSYIAYFKNEKYLERINNKYSKFESNDKKIIETIQRQVAASYKDRSRYWAINLNPYKEFRTIEFRIFPYVENPWELFEQIKFLMRFLKELYEKKISIKTRRDEIII